MPTVKTTPPADDPLGYDGTVIERLRKMAQDEFAGVNSVAVEEEAAVQEALNRPEIGCDWQALQKWTAESRNSNRRRCR
jgi:hypothetical protein